MCSTVRGWRSGARWTRCEVKNAVGGVQRNRVPRIDAFEIFWNRFFVRFRCGLDLRYLPPSGGQLFGLLYLFDTEERCQFFPVDIRVVRNGAKAIAAGRRFIFAAARKTARADAAADSTPPERRVRSGGRFREAEPADQCPPSNPLAFEVNSAEYIRHVLPDGSSFPSSFRVGAV